MGSGYLVACLAAATPLGTVSGGIRHAHRVLAAALQPHSDWRRESGVRIRSAARTARPRRRRNPHQAAHPRPRTGRAKRAVAPHEAAGGSARLRFSSHVDRILAEPRDVLVATGWRTAAPVASPAAQAARKYYLIQHHEIWDGPADEVNATWRLPLHKIVIARWLQDVARDLGVSDDVSYVPQRHRL